MQTSNVAKFDVFEVVVFLASTLITFASLRGRTDILEGVVVVSPSAQFHRMCACSGDTGLFTVLDRLLMITLARFHGGSFDVRGIHGIARGIDRLLSAMVCIYHDKVVIIVVGIKAASSRVDCRSSIAASCRPVSSTETIFPDLKRRSQSGVHIRVFEKGDWTFAN